MMRYNVSQRVIHMQIKCHFAENAECGGYIIEPLCDKMYLRNVHPVMVHIKAFAGLSMLSQETKTWHNK